MNRRAFFRAVGKALLAVPAVAVTAKLLPETVKVHRVPVYKTGFGEYRGYGSLGNVEDLSDLIYDIEPTETPFLARDFWETAVIKSPKFRV